MGAETATLPNQDLRRRVDTTLGMAFFIGSWTMAFGTLFLSFAVLRQRMGVWPPEGIRLPSFPMAALATVMLLASSVAIHRGTRASEAGAGVSTAWRLGMLAALAFTGLQAWLWMDLMGAGRLPTSGLYESLFYGLTWIHAVHVVCGLLALGWAQVGLSTGRYGPHHMSPVANAAIFWHFVDAVWVVLFLGFFVF